MYEDIAKHFHSVIKLSKEYQENRAVACNNPELLFPDFKDIIDILERNCIADGISISRRETFRTNALQLSYYKSGASKIKLNGMHHYGIAQDILCLDEKGGIIQSGSAKEYKQMRKLASSLGLHLLGEWDAGHFQFIATNMQNQLRSVCAAIKSVDAIILHYGIENHYVMNLKVALGKLGYEVNTDTNFFGDQTDETLRTYQADNNLTVDGICGKQVYNSLLSKGYNIYTM
ncbi:MAG: peptidoglycan-binding protein [Ignavibacteria bacterium]|jgi:hypothetical protein